MVGIAVDVGAHVITRADDIIDLLLVDVGFLAIRPDLIAPLKNTIAAPKHLVMRIRRGVIVAVMARKVLHQDFGPDDGKRTAHAILAVSRGDCRMASRT